MRLVMFDAGFGPRFGALLDEARVVDLPGSAEHVARTSIDPRDAVLPALVPNDSVAFLRLGPVATDAARDLVARCRQATDDGDASAGLGRFVRRRSDVTLLAPLTVPEKIIGIGLNYKSHADEQGARLPKVPLIFAKWNNTLIGPNQDIAHPDVSEALDYEAELAVVIGRRAKKVSESDALDYVAGYTCANDVTARDVQLADRQWVRGKTMDTLSPLGPAIVTPDEVPAVDKLAVRLWINDEILQDGNTASMIFDVPTLVSFLSHSFTLEPGDVILTGTPSGVGFKQDPPRYLKPGDRVRVSVDGLGELDNAVVTEPV